MPESALALAGAVPEVSAGAAASPLQGLALQLATVATNLSAHKAWLHRSVSAALATAVAQVWPSFEQ